MATALTDEAEAQSAPFCVVNGGGTNCFYYDRQSCQRAAGERGACVVNPSAMSNGGAQQQQPDPWSAFDRGAQIGARASQQQQSAATAPEPSGRRSPSATVLGGGIQITCRTWLATEQNRQLGDQWILGFWSGQNIRNAENPSVGATRDSQSILAIVHIECMTNPDQMLINAVQSTYTRFDREGR